MRALLPDARSIYWFNVNIWTSEISLAARLVGGFVQIARVCDSDDCLIVGGHHEVTAMSPMIGYDFVCVLGLARLHKRVLRAKPQTKDWKDVYMK